MLRTSPGRVWRDIQETATPRVRLKKTGAAATRLRDELATLSAREERAPPVVRLLRHSQLPCDLRHPFFPLANPTSASLSFPMIYSAVLRFRAIPDLLARISDQPDY